MEIKLTTRTYIAELSVESGSAKIVEDIAKNNNGKPYIPDVEIEKLITIARDMNWFNGKSDVDFVKMVYEAFLSDSERQVFLSEINEMEKS